MDQLNKVTERIFEIVDQADDKTVLGVRLGAALKKTFPSFAPGAYQCKNLRQFISKNVPKVVEKIYTGVDVTYTLASATPNTSGEPVQSAALAPPDPAPFISLPVNPTSWKAYSNPSFRFAIMANPETGEVRSIAENEQPPHPWVLIPKLAPEIHLQIAHDFVATLTDTSKATTLKALLADHQWYVSFFATAKRLGLSQQWGLFKREHMIRQFTAALHSHGISAAHSAPRRDLSTPPTPRKAFREPVTPSDEQRIRDLISRLAHTLPIDELRLIRMPIGFVIDAMRT